MYGACGRAVWLRLVRAVAARNDTARGEVEEAKAIHQYFCRCPSYGSSSCEADDKTLFQTIGRGGRGGTLPATIKGYKATQRVIDYFRNEVKAGRKIPAREGSSELHEYLDVFVTRKSSTYSMCTTNKEKLEEDKMALQVRITALEETVKVGGNTTKGMSEEEELAARNGSKMAGLITYLRKIQEKGEKTIIFSYWHDGKCLCSCLCHVSIMWYPNTYHTLL